MPAMLLVGALAFAPAPRVEIAPGVHMPLLNFGLQKNHSMAIALGARGLDTANVYDLQSPQQHEVGQAVRAAVAAGIPRSELFVTSKIECCPGGAFMGKIKGKLLCAVRGNAAKNIAYDFAKLGLDYVDLMLLHWPCDDLADSVRTYKALEGLVQDGRARAIGVSNFNASALAAFLPQIHLKPAVNQCGYSIAGHTLDAWGRDDATRMACEAHNITYSAYSPLGGWAKGGTGHVLDDPTVKAVAGAHNTTAAAVALRWVTQQGVVAVTSSDKASHVEDDLDSFALELTPEEMSRLSQVG